MYNTIKNSWTAKHIQLIIIIGLVVGIGIKSLMLHGYVEVDMASANVTEYKKAVVEKDTALECVDGQGDCLLEVLLEHYTQEDFKANRAYYMEQSRMNAFDKVNTALMGRLDDSPHYDYDAAKKQFGY